MLQASKILPIKPKKPYRKCIRARRIAWLPKARTDKVEEQAWLLSEGTWTHNHPITYETAQRFGLPMRCDIPSEFFELMNLYP